MRALERLLPDALTEKWGQKNRLTTIFEFKIIQQRRDTDKRVVHLQKSQLQRLDT